MDKRGGEKNENKLIDTGFRNGSSRDTGNHVMDGFPGLSGLGYWMMRGLILVNQLVTNIILSPCRHKSISADL